MAKLETMVSCPFCRRVYKMLLDRDAAERTRARASCGRCGNSFELAARVLGTNPERAATRAPEPVTTAKARKPHAVDPRSADADDVPLDELVRDIAQAAEHIAVTTPTPPRVAPPPPPAAARRTSDRIAPPPPPRPSPAPEPVAMTAEPDQEPSPAETAETGVFAFSATVPPMEARPSEPAAPSPPAVEPLAIAPAPEQSALVAPPTKASSPAVAATREAASPPTTPTAAPPLEAEPPAPPAPAVPPVPPAPVDWITRADPGLGELSREQGEAARVLSALIG